MAENIQGRVDITRTFDGRELNTEYLFGLFANLAASTNDTSAFSLLGVPVGYEITHFAASQNIASASTRYAILPSLTFFTHFPSHSQPKTLTSSFAQLPILLQRHQPHPPDPDPNLERLQPSRTDLNVRRILHRLVAMGRRRAPRLRTNRALRSGRR